MSDNNNRNELYSNAVRAGKRTYFFDVKATRGNDLYLTITESKKQYDNDDSGNFHYEKHKLFLYKEDFEKFEDGLKDVLAKIEELKSGGDFKVEETYTPKEEVVPAVEEEKAEASTSSNGDFTDVNFDDLS